MSAFQTDTKEFFDICVCMMLDYTKTQEDFIKSPRWETLMNKLMKFGLKSILLPIYLDTDIQARIKYRILMKSLKGSDDCYIHIKPMDAVDTPPDSEVMKMLKIPEIPKVNKDLIKKIFKKVKEVRFKTSMPITEEKLNKIIDYVVKKDQEEREDG